MKKARRGFAVMDRAQVREFARRGGIAAHVAGRAHEFNSDEARAAGRKGGLAGKEARRTEEQEKRPS
jgi:general stress protein YciG